MIEAGFADFRRASDSVTLNSFHAASFSPFFLAAALQNRKELHEILYVTVWSARLLSRWPGAICVSALGRKRCALLWKVRCAAIHSSTKGWWRCRCAGRANGWAERRSCGTSGFIDVQGAAAAKELRRKGLVVLTKRTC